MGLTDHHMAPGYPGSFKGGPMIRHIALLAVLLGFASTAHSQRAPDMATLDRGAGITKLGFDLGFSSLADPPYDAALRFELYGQYVTYSSLGFYCALPLSRFVRCEGEPQPPELYNRTSLGNADIGLLYVTKGRELSWVMRGGVVLPTSSDGLDEAFTRYYATAPR